MLKKFALIALVLVLPSLTAEAKCTVDEVSPPRSVTLPASDGTSLFLNGSGARRKFLWNVYVGALYLPSTTTDLDTILSMPGPKRIWLYFLRDVSAEKLLEGWQDGFQDNNTQEELAELQDRLVATYPLFREMREGETIAFDYLPDVGTQLVMNGDPGHIVPGEDFYHAILKIWLGKRPAQSGLKKCMLGDLD